MDHLFPKLCLNTRRGQLAWHSDPAIVSLMTHSHQAPLEILDKVGSRDILNFISSGKRFGVFLMVPSDPWLPGGNSLLLVGCGVGGPPWCFPGSHEPPDKGAPEAGRVSFFSVLQCPGGAQGIHGTPREGRIGSAKPAPGWGEDKADSGLGQRWGVKKGGKEGSGGGAVGQRGGYSKALSHVPGVLAFSSEPYVTCIPPT